MPVGTSTLGTNEVTSFSLSSVNFKFDENTFGNDWQGKSFKLKIEAQAIQADHVGVDMTKTGQALVDDIANAKATGETDSAWSGIGGAQQNLSNLSDLVNANKIELVANTGNVGAVGSEYKFGKVTISDDEYDIEWQLKSIGDDGYGLLVAKYILPESVMGTGSQGYFYKDQNSKRINTTTDTITTDELSGDTIMHINPNNYYYSNVRAYLNSKNGTGYGVSDYTSNGLSSLITNWNEIKDCVGRVNVCYPDTATAQAVDNRGVYQKGTGVRATTTYASTKDANGDYFFLLSSDDCYTNGYYFTDKASRIYNKIEANTTPYYWWYRSPNVTLTDYGCLVDPDGTFRNNVVSTLYGLLPALFIKL